MAKHRDRFSWKRLLKSIYLRWLRIGAKFESRYYHD